MAFISEIHFRSDSTPPAEYVEIALGPGEDPADYTVSFYNLDGTLKNNPEFSGPTEILLSDLAGVPNPGNPDYTIYTITASGSDFLMNGGNVDSLTEASHVALTNTNTSTVIDAISIGTNPTVTLSGGAADGEVTESFSGVQQNESLQWDIAGGNYVGDLTPGSVVCFGPDTLIKTSHGVVPVNELAVDDLVETVDHGLQPIRWIGVSRLSKEDLSKSPKLRPMRITAEALGPQCPVTDLIVSPQHRILVTSPIAERMFGTEEILLPAVKLLPLDGVNVVEQSADVEYWHFMFDRHEIIWANGAPAESLYLGPEALKSMSREAYREVMAVFPGITLASFRPKLSRVSPKSGNKIKTFLHRHVENQKPLS